MNLKLPQRFWLVLVLLGAFAYRVYRLGAESLWYDETVSLYLARLDLAALTQHTAGDIHPPFYYYLLHSWGLAAGWSEFSAAFLSVLFGILLIALVYRAARDWSTSATSILQAGFRNMPLIAALLVAISPYNLWYSQEVRMYTLGAFLGLASVYFLVRMLSRQTPGWRDLVFYSIISALGMYTLYYFAFLMVFENLAALVWFVQKFRSRDQGRKFGVWESGLGIWIASQVATLVLFSPWLPIAFKQATDPPVPPWRSFVALPNVLMESFTALAFGQSVDWQTPSWVWWASALVALVIVVGLTAQSLQSKPKDSASIGPTLGAWNLGVFLLAYSFVPLLIIYALSLWKPLYHVRYIFTYSPGFYILLAIGISKIWHYPLATTTLRVRVGSRLAILALACLFLFSAAISARNFWFDPQYADDDLRGAVKRISDNWRPGDAVLINAGYAYTAFVYYFDQPIAWRGRLTNYPPANVSLGTIQRLVDQPFGAVVLQTGSIGGDENLGWGSAESDFYATTAEETRTALDRVFATHTRVWMLRLYDTVVDPDGVVRDYLDEHARTIDDEGFAGSSFARVQGYLTTRSRITELPSTAIKREVLLGDRIMFLGYEPKELTVHGGQPIDVDLYWRAKEPTNVDAHLTLGLFREDGTLAAAADQLPLGNGLGTSRWGPEEIMREPARLIAPKNLPLGKYTLRISMYNPLTNEPMQAEKSGWVVNDSQIMIGTVAVE